jgi:hypothetical protein
MLSGAGAVWVCLIRLFRPFSSFRAFSTEAGRPIVGGLYRARVQGRDASGHTIAPQLFYFGVVQPRAE